ncbi:hypothetical protein FDR95_15610 [Rhizobiaceae bacterium LC148]|nr:hypothetical protein [Rhizobium sp. LC145]TKT56601.1 hypothetical protein FDR95_15610 [Rhizobiaceae bacterium LC148]
MKFPLIATTVALAVSSGASLAQTPNTPPSPPPQTEDDRSPPAPSPAGAPEMNGSDWRMHPSPRERGARFRIETGRTSIDLRCAEGETTKECADSLLQVLDRLQGSPSDDRSRRDDVRERPRDW